MSVIIRLQNLPWSASSVDIRKFFEGLSIPEGGVHIVGGEMGDAFIAFSTDEDARQAFDRNNRPLKQVQIKLALSSRTEMQKVIGEARTKPFIQTVLQTNITPITTTPLLPLAINNPLQQIMNKIPVAPQAPVITSTSYKDKQPSPKRDDKDKDTRSRGHDRDDSKSRDDRDDSKSRRERSRRRTKSRSRSRDRRDRSRDRRDRRRRERSRSKDRKDNNSRRRDNKRDRSKSRDRSKDRDSRRSSDKNNSRNRRHDSKGNEIIEIKDDAPNPPPPRIWDQKPNMSSNNNEMNMSQSQQAFMGNFTGANLEDARRSLGLLTGMQNNMNSTRFSRNDNTNNNWQQRKRFQDRNTGSQLLDNTSNDNKAQMLNPFQHGLRPNFNQNLIGSSEMRSNPNVFQSQSMRMPFSHNQDNAGGFGLNRPFLARPGTVFPDNKFRSHDYSNSNSFNMNQDRPKSRFDNKEGCCVLVRPYFGGYGELRKFFSGLFISNTGVKFVMNEFGKRTGIVYVKFVRPDGKEQALQRTGMTLRNVPVEVKHVDDEEWECCGEDDDSIKPEEQQQQQQQLENRKEPDARNSPLLIDSQQQKLNTFTCVVIDDLPDYIKEHHIVDMFADYTLVTVHIAINKKFRHLAYIQFGTEEEAASALANKTSHVINGKPVSVRPISDETFNEVQRQQANGELVDVDYDKTISSASHDLQLEKFTTTTSASTTTNGPRSKSPHIITDCVVLNGLSPKTTDRDVLDFFSDIGIVPTKIHIMHSQFGPSGDAYCEFNNPDDAVCALDKNGLPLGAGTIRVELVYRRDMERALGLPNGPPLISQPLLGPRFPSRFGPRVPALMSPRGPPTNLLRRRPPGSNLRYDGPVDAMGPQGCVVSMENVPFKAGVNEILDFFENYELESHNVFRRFNDNGAPTGDARVTFNSSEEARRAVDECNRMKIRDRTVFLRIL